MVQITPHSVTVASVAQPLLDDSVMENPQGGAASAAIACLCVPMRPGETFERYGVVLTDCWTVYLNLPVSTPFGPQARIAFNGKTYWQQGDVEIHENGDAADCGLVYMTMNQYPVVT